MKTNKNWQIYSNTKFDIEVTFGVMKLLCSGNIKWASLQRRPSEVLRNSALNKNMSPKFGPGSRHRDQGTKFKVQWPKQRKRTCRSISQTEEVKFFLFVTNTHHHSPLSHVYRFILSEISAIWNKINFDEQHFSYVPSGGHSFAIFDF